MTDFYSVGSAEKEFEQGKNAIDAAKEVHTYTIPIAPGFSFGPATVSLGWLLVTLVLKGIQSIQLVHTPCCILHCTMTTNIRLR